MADEQYIDCIDLVEVVEFGCCMSCHHEWDDGYGEPMEREVGGVTLLGCCGALSAIEDLSEDAVARLFAEALRFRAVRLET